MLHGHFVEGLWVPNIRSWLVLDEPNPGPWTRRRFADIEGRSDDVFVYDRVEVHPYAFRSAIGRRREVLEYQVRQTSTGAEITLRYQSLRVSGALAALPVPARSAAQVLVAVMT